MNLSVLEQRPRQTCIKICLPFYRVDTITRNIWLVKDSLRKMEAGLKHLFYMIIETKMWIMSGQKKLLIVNNNS